MLVMVNAWWQPLQFALPVTGLADGRWHRWIDTALPSPSDIVAWDEVTPPLAGADAYCRAISFVGGAAGALRG
jgi:hypothetical protein